MGLLRRRGVRGRARDVGAARDVAAGAVGRAQVAERASMAAAGAPDCGQAAICCCGTPMSQPNVRLSGRRKRLVHLIQIGGGR